MTRFAPIQFTPAVMAQYGALFSACFPDGSMFTPAYLEWLYVGNPDGAAVGFDAWEGEQLAAHYVCVPATVAINGVTVKVLLSLNTATHPQFQGKGLFTKLATLTYEAGAAAGFDGVYGVANGSSTPGFIRKLGFQLVRPLEARVGLGRLHTDASAPLADTAFRRIWTDTTLAWRCARPGNPVTMRRSTHGREFFAAAFGKAVPAYAILPPADAPTAPPIGHLASPLRLFLGLVPDAQRHYWNYASIPQRFRPSPLNLIYRSFTARVERLDPSAVTFSFLDFDAY